ncbi:MULTISPECIES: DUF982 domain-containing protein [Neorhizobium]|uniref:DUF982 domain-containing protein n=1 Tax=Neorhizobium huautlense TaxID=67774 RepID=UPI000CF893CB
MGQIIPINFAAHWNLPVFIEQGGYPNIGIEGPAQAIRYMQLRFRCRSGPLYWKALLTCYSAVRREVDPEEVRRHFLAACAEAEWKSP